MRDTYNEHELLVSRRPRRSPLSCGTRGGLTSVAATASLDWHVQVAGGLMSRDEDGLGRMVLGEGEVDPLHAMRVVAFGRAMLEEALKVALPNTGERVQVGGARQKRGRVHRRCLRVALQVGDRAVVMARFERHQAWREGGGAGPWRRHANAASVGTGVRTRTCLLSL